VTATLGSGDAGNIEINSYFASLSGYNTKTLSPTLLSSFTANGGNGGNLFLNSNILLLVNGGRVDASTNSSGNAGSVFINSDYILVRGVFPAKFNGNSFISSSGNKLDPTSESLYPGLTLNLTGDAGDVVIKANKIDLKDGGQISVKNDGSGNAGKLSIFADEIKSKDSSITASTQGGDGGSIEITTTKLIAQNSLISASARGNGNGGNIFITGSVIFGRNSYLRANAENGRGGDITIDVNGFSFPRENITAISTSGANINGKVNINATNTTLSLLSLYKPPNVRYSFSTTCKPNPRKSLSVHGGSGMVPEQFDEPIETAIHAKNTYYRLDLKTRKKIPLGEAMLSWRDNGDGTGSPVSELPDPLSIASLPAFHCFDSPVASAKNK
jgi:large exoprotein involved in heme utilization and adhesion